MAMHTQYNPQCSLHSGADIRLFYIGGPQEFSQTFVMYRDRTHGRDNWTMHKTRLFSWIAILVSMIAFYHYIRDLRRRCRCMHHILFYPHLIVLSTDMFVLKLRQSVPLRFTRNCPAGNSTFLTLRLALVPSNLTSLDQELYAVSIPGSDQ